MTVLEAAQTLSILADGIDPITGEVYDEGPYLHPQITRALLMVLGALEKKDLLPKPKDRTKPKRSGETWTDEEDNLLRERFDAEIPLSQIAKLHGRTKLAIEARLDKLGLRKYPAYLEKNYPLF